MEKLMKIGHRGAAGYEPENTRRSFLKAIELGVDMIELDVHLCRSGELVVIHDDRVDRTTNGTGAVAQKTLDEIKALDAGKGEKILTLPEALEAVNKRTRVNIELKGADTARSVSVVIEEHVQKHGWSYDDFLVSSFDHHQLQRFNRLTPGVRIGALIAGIPVSYAKLAEKIPAQSVHLQREYVNRDFVKDAHKRGMKVLVYTVDQPEDIEKMKALGVDGMFSNYPDRLLNK